MAFVSSGAAVAAYTAWGAYGSSKAALHSFATHLAVEEPEITSLSISPGRVDTDMQRILRAEGKDAMKASDYAGFASAFESGGLLKPEQPAAVFAAVVLTPPRELSGKFLK